MKDVRDELVHLVFKISFRCAAVFVIAVAIRDLYSKYIFDLLFDALNESVRRMISLFICLWPFISVIITLLKGVLFIVKNILLTDVTLSKEYYFFFVVVQIVMIIFLTVGTISVAITNITTLLY